MKLSFKMTADDYYQGFKLKLNDIGDKNKRISTVIILAIFCIPGIISGFTYYIAFLAIFAAVMLILMPIIQKNSIKKQFERSIILNSTHTICTYTEGLEIINSYEKIFVPWQSIYSVRLNENNLIIMPIFRKGIFVISRSRYQSSELDELINIIRTNTTVKEGKS